MYKGADRPNIMKIFFAERSLVLGDINELESVFDGDTDGIVQHLIVNLLNKKFAKELSQIGGITLDRDSFADYFRSSNGKQLWVDKLSHIVTHSDGTNEKKTKFRVWRDYGNAVYASWMRWFLGQEQAYRVFSTDKDEKLGDGLETVLGFFDVEGQHGAFYCASLVEKYVAGLRAGRPLPRIDEECSEAIAARWIAEDGVPALYEHTSAKGRRVLGIVAQQLHEGKHEPSLPAGMLDEVERFLREREKVDADARRCGL